MRSQTSTRNAVKRPAPVATTASSAGAGSPAPTRPGVGSPTRHGQRSPLARRPMGVPAPSLDRPIRLSLPTPVECPRVTPVGVTSGRRHPGGARGSVRFTDRGLAVMLGVIAAVCMAAVITLGVQFLSVSDAPGDQAVAAAQR